MATRIPARARVLPDKTKFFVPDKTVGFLERVAHKVNGRFGGYVRKVARNSMKRATRQSSINQLTPDQLIAYNAKRRRWHKGGHRWAEPKLPPMPARPGEPPRVVSGELKKFLAYDRSTESGVPYVVVGSEKLEGAEPNKGFVPSLNENSGTGEGTGGITVKFPKRPFMSPAAAKAYPQVPSWVLQAVSQTR